MHADSIPVVKVHIASILPLPRGRMEARLDQPDPYSIAKTSDLVAIKCFQLVEGVEGGKGGVESSACLSRLRASCRDQIRYPIAIGTAIIEIHPLHGPRTIRTSHRRIIWSSGFLCQVDLAHIWQPHVHVCRRVKESILQVSHMRLFKMRGIRLIAGPRDPHHGPTIAPFVCSTVPVLTERETNPHALIHIGMSLGQVAQQSPLEFIIAERYEVASNRRTCFLCICPAL